MVNTLSELVPPSRDEKLAQLERIVTSRTFQGAEILKSFLSFVVGKSVDGLESELKEYTIATDVFGRKEDYDPRIDSLVRVQATRLRSKLEEYYVQEGKLDQVLIQLPKGHYVPFFARKGSYVEPKEASVGEGSPSAFPSPGRVSQERSIFLRKADRYLLMLLLGVNMVFGYLAYHYYSIASRQTGMGSSVVPNPGFIRDIAPLWEKFLGSDNSLLIAYSNPVFQGNAVSGMKYWLPMEQSSPNLRPPSVSRMTEPHSITDVYTGVGEVMGVNFLGSLLWMTGTPFRVERSLLLTWEDLKTQNIVFLGGPTENILLRRLPQEQDFVYQSEHSKDGIPKVEVFNRVPRGTEQSHYEAIFEGTSQSMVTRDYGLISMLKGIEPNRHLLILAGITTFGTQACAEYVSKPETVKELIRHLNLSADSSRPRLPDSYQVLLEVKIEGSIPVKTSYVTHHVLN